MWLWRAYRRSPGLSAVSKRTLRQMLRASQLVGIGAFYVIALGVALILIIPNLVVKGWDKTWPELTLATAGLAVGVGFTGLVVEVMQRKKQRQIWAPARRAVLENFLVAGHRVASAILSRDISDSVESLVALGQETLGQSLVRLERRFNRCVSIAKREVSTSARTPLSAGDLGDPKRLRESIDHALARLDPSLPSRDSRLTALRLLRERVLPSLGMLDDPEISALVSALDAQITTLELRSESVVIAARRLDDVADPDDPFGLIRRVMVDLSAALDREREGDEGLSDRLDFLRRLSIHLQSEAYTLMATLGTLLDLAVRFRAQVHRDNLDDEPSNLVQ